MFSLRLQVIVCLDSGKAICTVSQKILIEKLKKYELDEQTLRWIKNCLNDWHQRVISGGRNSLVVYLGSV